MADVVYLVCGSTGEYSDHTYWHIAVYSTKEQAEEHAKKAKEWTESLTKEKHEAIQKLEYWDYDKPRTNPYDPMNYTGTDYVVEEIPFVRHVDEYLEHIQDHPK